MVASRSLLARLWLPIAILLAAGVALAYPPPGRWMSDSRAASILVPLVMFLVSLRVPGSRMLDVFKHPLAIVGCLVLVYGIFPPVALGWQALLGPHGDEPYAAMAILAAQPSTLATAAVLTQIAGGNAALAVVCTVVTQILSVLATPWILALYVGHGVAVDTWSLMWDLARSVLLPIAAGQLLRLPITRWLERRPAVLSTAAEAIVVSFVLMGFSTARPLLERDPGIALLAFGTVVLIHLSMLALSTAAGFLLRLDGAGRVAFTLSSSQKTVAAGVLVWQAGFPGNQLGPIFVVLHHLLQTVADSLLAPQMHRIRLGKRRLFPLTS